MEAQLADTVERIAAETGGVVAVAAREVHGARSYRRLAEEQFPAASVIKVLILVELLARVETGELSLAQRLPVRAADKTPGSGVLRGLRDGLELSLEELAYLMIVVSDNTASNMLIDLLTPERIDARGRALGLHRCTLQRRFFDLAAREQGRDNLAAAGDLAELLAGLERRTVVSPAASEKALAILREQQFDGKIPRLLPPGTKVAHKTGTISSASHDAGVIYAPRGPLALAVLTRDAPTAAAAESAIRRIARAVYDAWGA
jgi:beta-lactamase class A